MSLIQSGVSCDVSLFFLNYCISVLLQFTELLVNMQFLLNNSLLLAIQGLMVEK